MRVRHSLLLIVSFILLAGGPPCAAHGMDSITAHSQDGGARTAGLERVSTTRSFLDSTPVSGAGPALSTTTVTVTTSDGGAIPAGTEIQVIKVDPEPSELLHGETLASDQPSGYQILDLPTDPEALYSVNVFPPSGYAATATGTYHGGINIDVELEALPPTPTPTATDTPTATATATATNTPTATATATNSPTPTHPSIATSTPTVGATTPESTATLAPTVAPTEPPSNPTATLQVAQLPTTGQGNPDSGPGMGVLALLVLAGFAASLATVRLRRR
jgi:hypothetical protein